jgi:hypothetical protein
MPVNTEHPEHTRAKKLWRLSRLACAGNQAVKDSGELALPAEFAKDYPDRYKRYKDRAYFMGVTGRTRDALVGMIFRKPPTTELTPAVEAIQEDIDGAGQSITQIAKQAAAELLETGRYAFLVDYPSTEDIETNEQQQSMGIHATVAPYPAESLINWRFDGVKGKQQLTLAVLLELVEKDNHDEFSHETERNYRVLRLEDGVYTQQLYDHNLQPLGDAVTPRMAGGAPFDHIPLHIVGAQNNLPDVDTPPLYDLAVVNIAHYRNVADLEESGFVIAQPMLHIDLGDTDPATWSTQNPNGVTLGSRHGITTVRGKAEIIQAQSDNLNSALKVQKEQEMVALGARLVQRGGANETAEAARINASAEASTLDTMTNNLSEAIEAALEDVARFEGDNPEPIEYKLNTDFWESGLDPQALQVVIAGRQSGLYAQSDALHMIRSGRIQLRDERDDETIQQDVANDLLNDFDDSPIGSGA